MTIRTVGIVGAGTMGSGIATNVAASGLAVTLVDVSEEAAKAAVNAAAKFYARTVEKGRMSVEDAHAAEARLTASDDLSAVADCDLVIEAVFEDAALKAELFGKLRDLLKGEAIVATNTSCLRVSDLAQHVANPAAFCGMHYFNPAAVNPIVEVVRGERTDDATIEAVLAFCKATHKKPLLCRDNYGFAINRFFCPYSNEAVRLLDEGAGTTAEIDRVAQDCVGAAAGPFFVMNMIKPRINCSAIENLAPLGAFYSVAKGLKDRAAADANWEIEEPAETDPTREKSIADRLLGATFFAVLDELDNEVASPDDIDAGAEMALKFGKPPCRSMDLMGRDAVEQLVHPFAQRYGREVPRSLSRVGSLRG
ncbi:MAG: 3-hydroxyacyl-CoA dehydrogenase NAD-binding domain-containing protein [Alphaproteobacteria bacterium]|nr:3-hydroxyacyl-CoA dehydrogenase NAD-binding domain-containing protein [Alphaproteobacteria bacterium]